MTKPTRISIVRIAIVGGTVAVLVVILFGYQLMVANQAYREQKDVSNQIDRGAIPLSAENPPNAESFHPVRVLSRQPSISEFPVVSAQEADKVFDDDELILGVEIEGQARAYSLNSLNGPAREIFNDTLGGTPIIATW